MKYSYDYKLRINHEFQIASAKVNLNTDPEEPIKLFEVFTNENDLFISFCASDLTLKEIIKIIVMMFKEIGFFNIIRILKFKSFSVMISIIKILWYAFKYKS